MIFWLGYDVAASFFRTFLYDSRSRLSLPHLDLTEPNLLPEWMRLPKDAGLSGYTLNALAVRSVSFALNETI